jgi:putative sterol carrier protein
MTALRNVFLQARDRFDRKAAEGLEACIQFSIPDAGDCYLTVTTSNCQLHDGVAKAPTSTLVMDQQTLIDILNGSLNAMQAFMFGRIRVEGNVKHATRLVELFPIDEKV